MTPIGLERSAAWHLTRKAMTEAELKTALLKKVRRARLVHGEEPQALEWVEALMERLRSSLLLDDARVAHARVESGRARGLSTRLLQQKLRRQGLTEDVVATAFSEVDDRSKGDQGGFGQGIHDDDDEDLPPDLRAACIYGRRRRLTNKDPQKALAALARQGFSFDIAKRALARLQEEEAVDGDADDADDGGDGDDGERS